MDWNPLSDLKVMDWNPLSGLKVMDWNPLSGLKGWNTIAQGAAKRSPGKPATHGQKALKGRHGDCIFGGQSYRALSGLRLGNDRSLTQGFASLRPGLSYFGLSGRWGCPIGLTGLSFQALLRCALGYHSGL
jgi:hypothetical protein